MAKRIIIGAAPAIFVAFILLATSVTIGTRIYSQDNSPNITHPFQHSVLINVPYLIFGAIITHPLRHSNSGKQATINRSAKNNGKISIFEGRSAVRNMAIFHILVTTGPLSIGDIQRSLNKVSGLEVAYYASLNKRIHALVRGGYIGEVKHAADQDSRFKVCRYEVRTKFYLAYYLNSKSREEILSFLNEPNATIILSVLINAEATEI